MVKSTLRIFFEHLYEANSLHMKVINKYDQRFEEKKSQKIYSLHDIEIQSLFSF